ncbi:unnamed protein product, partial [Iphiclides podalirius]
MTYHNATDTIVSPALAAPNRKRGRFANGTPEAAGQSKLASRTVTPPFRANSELSGTAASDLSGVCGLGAVHEEFVRTAASRGKDGR